MFFSDITTQSKAVLCDILDDSAQVTNLIYMPQKTFVTLDGTGSINELFVNYMYSLLTFNSNSKRTRLQQEKSLKHRLTFTKVYFGQDGTVIIAAFGSQKVKLFLPSSIANSLERICVFFCVQCVYNRVFCARLCFRTLLVRRMPSNT